MTLYSVEFTTQSLHEAEQLPPVLRRRLKANLEFLRAGPFRSHAGVRVKEIRDLRGIWRFHLDPKHRVFYATIGSRLIVIMVERSPGVTPRTLSEIRRRRKA